ncbi:hypothetical protein QYF61_009135, partial [Mycteria americana]
MARDHKVYEEKLERLAFFSLKNRRMMEGPSCRQQYPIGGYRENRVTFLSKSQSWQLKVGNRPESLKKSYKH